MTEHRAITLIPDLEQPQVGRHIFPVKGPQRSPCRPVSKGLTGMYLGEQTAFENGTYI